MEKLGGYMYQYRNGVLIFWVVVIVFSVLFAIKLPSVLSGNGFEYNGEYSETRTILEEDFGQAKSSIILVFQREATVSDQEWHKFMEDTFVNLDDSTIAQKTTAPFDRDGMVKDKYAYGLLSFDKGAESL